MISQRSRLDLIWVGLFLLLSQSCARQEVREERLRAVDSVAAVSLLGNDFAIDLISPSPLTASTESLVDISGWKLDESFRELLRQGAVSRGRVFQDFTLDPDALKKALSVRESRWKRVEGKESQALLDLLFAEAERRGLKYFFLLTPFVPAERPAPYRYPSGVFCSDRKPRPSRAYPYFVFRFSLWKVESRQRVFAYEVKPGDTDQLVFADCRELATMKNPELLLEKPVKDAMDLVVAALFEKLGWKKP
ncbi:MAG TPA: hypothetical protein VIH99_07260 [Bdellovibrionota bacterium]|jgi:hypothetical protein